MLFFSTVGESCGLNNMCSALLFDRSESIPAPRQPPSVLARTVGLSHTLFVPPYIVSMNGTYT